MSPETILSRRGFAGLMLGVGAQPSGVLVADQRYVDLIYADGRLTWPGGSARAACGKSGVRAAKREGDGASPAGTFPLVSGFYRPDRVAPPRTDLPMIAIQSNHGWVDEPADPKYNRLIQLPYPAHHEEMWLADHVYDIVVVIGYNTDPVVPGAGSAIFMHIARPDFSPTAGCIAVSRQVLEPLLGLLGPGSTITIQA
jgi:L,D-peptidoglycan transpeptidase YkuD (ErfK/YbiS/YcfS/YnhG family)